MSDSETKNINPISSNILDKVMGSQTQSNLSEFQPTSMVNSLLLGLKQRDREILGHRFGLAGMEIETLEAIGKKFNLTRERVRQIEKDSLAGLRKNKSSAKDQALSLIFDTILEHGHIMSEEFLIQIMLLDKQSESETAAFKFLLNIGDQLSNLKETGEFYESWYVRGFDLEKLKAVIDSFVSILEAEDHVVSQISLYDKFRDTEFYREHVLELTESILKSYLNISKAIQINPFNEIGLKNWSEVRPRDVGDKAYLVLKHHGKPEHYSDITKLINEHRFDAKTAYQETVHNELIKDSRFVLIGRGIYALTEWGYKKGVVADVIKEILRAAGKPLNRDEIISEVMKKRQVKRNTILVGLSNRKNFTKVGKDKYQAAPDGII
ncbi:MAG: hypothetical protein A3J07_02475 [Candidatus Doudnabacteria bacterium RIFCSPLOWO2_02_FULL_49_13]|uniref:HTH HARE-type domain-containing protein n=1 Tax=Candidatus Doudnabacteria bacterium RIFCSPHIGHO2_12_FULL_48_16 TaxID=1817838 RepID=A0A1F5PKV1_9BACT|nr:MAG: hypothetical protein A3B77_03350 [Candidatus Doudnabacteria bacterium RIFCSPHIGHO2_02_FULL_49_24]OGE89158.1 MAG: hypothetical protein A2760_02095 [Candidatus Doudnabacteria bacterium RIFCSPHIGHO2_01_FULL_50_67]OGE90546.1 MAG: hypothetical protein A3E29_01990 [Candidatus Doudnabacteria bacterium RIFCSPHIGHO2_12_FULL_48_16]OGE97184.1 MAG: hypothetical protein A2990_01125 [Candidatus Doudnabacteria bacterium RIFCSPLOWO2_01_FULL_49_40]OGF02938.1 MAG: hypothetical protein A3J07_02475 [Candid